MPRLVYSTLFILLTPFIVVRLMLRSISSPKYRERIGERFVRTLPEIQRDNSEPLIWIHAVSVGEVVAAESVVKSLLADDHKVLITTMTPTGSDRVRLLFGNSVFHCYLPYDISTLVTKFLNSVKPSMLLIMETELWPNLLYHCEDKKIPVLLINGRMSAKSAKGYQRFSALTQPMFKSLTCIAAQSEADAERFQTLGSHESNIVVTGSLKFKVNINDGEEPEGDFFESISSCNRSVIIAASTREGEEEKILNAFEIVSKENPSVVLLIVPRHPERFESVAKLCEKKNFELLSRTTDTPFLESTQVLLGDSMGEMISYYRLADIAFVGGSLVNTGCQNVLEPAALGIPVVVGPSQYNFATICKQLEEAGGLITVNSETALAKQINEWLANPAEAQSAGLKAFDEVQRNQHALPQVLEIIESQLN